MTSPAPTPSESARQHSNSDVDGSQTSQHHTCGIQHNQASPGDHNHNGKNSRKVGKGVNVAFPTTATVGYTQAQMQSIIDALRALGLGT
jgi:hypothetical protein